MAASAGIPNSCVNSLSSANTNDAAGVRDELAREGDSIAAVILEPVFHNAGAVLPEPGFLEAIREAAPRRAPS